MICPNCNETFVPSWYEIIDTREDDHRIVVSYRVQVGFPAEMRTTNMTLEKAMNVDVSGKVERVPKVWTHEEVIGLIEASIMEQKAAIATSGAHVHEIGKPLSTLIGATDVSA